MAVRCLDPTFDRSPEGNGICLHHRTLDINNGGAGVETA